MRDQRIPTIAKIKTSPVNVTKQQACMYVWNPDQRLSLKKFLYQDLCPLKTSAKRPGIPPLTFSSITLRSLPSQLINHFHTTKELPCAEVLATSSPKEFGVPYYQRKYLLPCHDTMLDNYLWYKSMIKQNKTLIFVCYLQKDTKLTHSGNLFICT
jgi:hypothetical protein